MAASDPIRLLVVEDVPQVAQYVRSLLNTQTAIKVLDVVADGARVPDLVRELRPDVVLVDALLQGRVKGPQLVDLLHQQDPRLGILVLTVPQQPVVANPQQGIHGVLVMPFSGFDLVGQIQAVYKATRSAGQPGAGRVVAVFAPKGGVGKTTISFNLACALAQQGLATVLVDGSLQFADLRALLRVAIDVPSIVDLPTDRITETDLQEVLWRDPAGIDILLAPPRLEQAEMVTVRDIDKLLSLLRRLYAVIVVDTPMALSETTLAFLDAADVILQIVTFDSTTIHNTVAVADTFRQIGYPPGKVRYLVNRADSAGGISEEELERALGRPPEHRVVSDGRLVVQANNDGVPFVLVAPEAPISRDVVRVATELAAVLGIRQPVRT
jgi:pilus assembly protein CpaE